MAASSRPARSMSCRRPRRRSATRSSSSSPAARSSGASASPGRVLGRIKPDAVVGFGGYPVFPPFLAAALRGMPGLLHEQNAVMGRANRALARFAKRHRHQLSGDANSPKPIRHKITLTGNPVRDRVRDGGCTAPPTRPPHEGGPIQLLVFGGSQGARAFSDFVPPAIALAARGAAASARDRPAMPAGGSRPRRRGLSRPQGQCRTRELLRRSARADDRAAIWSSAARARRPSPNSAFSACRRIFVPLPGSIDADQKNNAAIIRARPAPAGSSSRPRFRRNLLPLGSTDLFNDPDELRDAAQRPSR